MSFGSIASLIRTYPLLLLLQGNCILILEHLHCWSLEERTALWEVPSLFVIAVQVPFGCGYRCMHPAHAVQDF